MFRQKLSLLLALGTGSVMASQVGAAPFVIDISGEASASSIQAPTADGSRTIFYNRIGTNSSVGNLSDTDGNRRAIALTWVAGKAGANNTVAAGYITAPAAAMFPDIAARTFIGLSTPQNTFLRWRLDGLNLATTYDFSFFCSREGTGNANTAFNILGTNTLTGSINPKGNTGSLLNLAGAVPDSYGSLEIVVTFGAGNTGSFTYFNAFQFTENSQSAFTTIPEPTSLLLLALGTVGLLARKRTAQQGR